MGTAIGVGDGREGGSVEVSHPSHPITLDHDRPDRPKGAVEGLLGVCVRGCSPPTQQQLDSIAGINRSLAAASVMCV